MKQTNVSLRQMRAFVTLAHYSSFRQAADALNLSQSALSTAIQQMEAELAAQLFDRTTRRVELTIVGRNLFPTVERILADIEISMEDVRSEALGTRGRVVVSALLSIVVRVLPIVVERFKAKYPNVKIVVLAHTLSAIHRSLQVNEADIGVCGHTELESDLDFEFLVADRFQAILPLRHPLAKASEIRWRELSPYPFVIMTRGTQIRDLIESVLQRQKLSLTPVCEMSEPMAIEAMVESKLGISVLPKSALTPNNNKLCVRPLVEPMLERRLGTITRKGRTPSPAAAAFRAELGRYMGEKFRR